MRTYRVRIDIVSTDHGPNEHGEVNLNVSANSVNELVAHASAVIPSFAPAPSAVQVHERLVAAQNKEPVHAAKPADKSAGDHAGG